MSKLRRFESSHRKEPHSFPVPKGNSVYAQAKKAEYIEKNTTLAKSLYQEAINVGERKESAVKDLASILHQEGRTQEAIDLLLEYKNIFTDHQKFQNLLVNLQEKLIPTGNSLIKFLKVFPLAESASTACVKRLFRDPSRITYIDLLDSVNGKYALLHFSSHSAARKTLNTFHRWSGLRVEWSDHNGKRVNENELNTDMETAILLLGRELMNELCFENNFNAAANPFVPDRVFA